jgi:hypothetical protein
VSFQNLLLICKNTTSDEPTLLSALNNQTTQKEKCWIIGYTVTMTTYLSQHNNHFNFSVILIAQNVIDERSARVPKITKIECTAT